jgi:hypothetical protein
MKNLKARECVVCGKYECNDPRHIAIAELRGGDRKNELLMRYCIEHVYDHVRVEQERGYKDIIELLCRICGCTEDELFKMFKEIAEDGGYDLVYVL